MAESKRPMGHIFPKKIQETIHNVGEKKIQVGYEKAEIRREEGEKWEDEYGKEWEMKNGIVQSIPKFTDVRVPLFCPKCSGIMGKRSKDTEVYYKFGFCLQCLLDRDAEMEKEGTFIGYQEKYMNNKKEGFLKETKVEIENYIKELNEKDHLEYVDGEGKIKKMEVNINDLRDFWKKELEEVNKELEKVEQNIGED
jgi:hypothetical protein